MLTWNIFMLPGSIKASNKDKRAAEIGNILKTSDYDVVVLEEAFRRKSRKIIKKQLKGEFPYMSLPPKNKPFSLKTNSGVWILSKIKLKTIKHTRFKSCSGIPDCMAEKGATLVECEKAGKKFRLIGTHLQAENFPLTRRKQFKQIKKDLIDPFNDPDIPMIIAGDLNTEKSDSLNYFEMLKELEADDKPAIDNIKTTWKGRYNQPYDPNARKTILDYILIKKNGRNVHHSNRKILMFKSQKHDYFLSDHFGVEMTMEF